MTVGDKTLLLAVGVVLVGTVAVAAVTIWLLRGGDWKKIFGAFLILAPFNYAYVALFDWQVTWAARGGVTGGGPAAVKFGKDLIFLAIAGIWLLHWILRRLLIRRVTVLDALVVAFLAVQAVMIVPSVAAIGLRAALVATWQNAGYTLGYFMTRSALSEAAPDTGTRFLFRLELVAVVVSVLGILQLLFKPESMLGYVEGTHIGFARITSTMGSPNNLGMFLAAMIAVGALLGRGAQRIWRVAVNTGALVFTLSMSSILGLAATFGGLAVVRGRWRTVVAAALVIVVAVIVVMSAAPSVAVRVQNVFRGEDQSFLMRLDNWRRLLPVTPVVWILGGGAGTGGSMTVSFFDAGGVADSQYLALLIQFGLVGVFLFVSILLVAETCALYAAVGRNALPVMHVIAGVIMLYALFAGVVNVLNVFPMNLYFWCCIAMTQSPNAVRSVHD